jgi:spore germination cell wall hydrolase CwlJ-like protein
MAKPQAATAKTPVSETSPAKLTSMDEPTPEAVRCLALNVYHEARSEPKEGQVAVAAVTLNRVKSNVFPNSVCKVVKQGGQQRNRCQFSWWCDGKRDHPTEETAWQQSQKIARLSLQGATDDPTHGALYYHAEYVEPRWSRKLERTARIGNHLFYRPAKRKPVRIAVTDGLSVSLNDPIL